MSILSSLLTLAKPRRAAPPPRLARSHRDLLSTAIVDTLRTHGIPSAWLAAETFPAATPHNPSGVHLQIVVKTANPKLLVHIFALELAIRARLRQLDAHSHSWVAGTSWRIDAAGLENASLPGPAFWRNLPERQKAPAKEFDVRESLSRTIAAGDRAFARTAWQVTEFASTEPVPVR